MDARQAAASRAAASAAAAPPAPTSPFAPTSTPFIPPPVQAKTSTPPQHASTVSDAAHAALHPVPQQPEMVNACETLINVARSLNARPVYDIQRVGGEDHQPLFHASVELFPQGYVAKGVGRSKMASRRDAASNMLRQIYSKTVHQSAPMPSASASAPSQPISQPISQPQIDMRNPSSYPLQSRSFPSNYASYSQPAYPSMSQPPVPEQPPVGSQPFQTAGQQPQLLPHAQQPPHQHPQHPLYRQSQPQTLPPHAFPPPQHQVPQQRQLQPQPLPQLPQQPQPQPRPPSQSQLQMQQQQQQPLQYQYQLQPQQSLAQQQPLQHQSSFNPVYDQQRQPPPQQEPEQPMFYVDRSPDSDLEREIEEEEQQKQQQQQKPIETAAVHTAIPPAPPPAADTSTPSATAPSNITSQPTTTSPSVPIPVAPLAHPQELQPSIAIAATSTTGESTKPAASSASVGRAQQVGPKPGDASAPRLPSTSAAVSTVPAVETASDSGKQAPISVQIVGSTTKPAESESHADGNASVPSRVPQPTSQAPAPLPPTSTQKPGSSGNSSAVQASVPPTVEPSVAQSIKQQSSQPESGPSASLALKRKLEGDVRKPDADEHGSIAVAAEPQRKKARGTSSHPPVKLHLHVVCILDERVRKSLQDLVKANLFIRPHIHLFSSNDVTAPIQLGSGVTVPVTSFDQSVYERQERVAMALAFEAGSLSNDLWVERAKHLAKGLPSTLMPRMIILSDNHLFQAFVRKGVIDVVDPKDDLAKYASEILQRSSDSQEMVME